MSQNSIVLAYSGGLDTSCILKWLKLKDFRVIAYVADVGQDEDFDQVRKNAEITGADEVVVVDCKREFVEDYISHRSLETHSTRTVTCSVRLWPAYYRQKQVEVAREYGANYVSHGATGKGNDQVRFELAYAALAPDSSLCPWKDQEFLNKFQGRVDLINFAEEQGITIPVTLKKPYSTDENLMHKSYESGMLEDPNHIADTEIFTVCVDPTEAPDQKEFIEIEFKDGRPVRVKSRETDREETDALALFNFLNDSGASTVLDASISSKTDSLESRAAVSTRHRVEPSFSWRTKISRASQWMQSNDCGYALTEASSDHLQWLLVQPGNGFPLAAINKSKSSSTAPLLSLYKGNVLAVGRTSTSSLYDQDLSVWISRVDLIRPTRPALSKSTHFDFGRTTSSLGKSNARFHSFLLFG